MFTRCRSIGALSICVVLSLSSHAAATEKTVTFAFQPVVRGQQIAQHISVRTNTTTTYEQSQQIISASAHNVLSDQVRQITVLDSEPNPTRVKVTYARAILKAGKSIFAKSQPQPVDKKSYLVARVDGALTVTDIQGGVPPEEELLIVRSNMQWVGQPNPLAQFLNGRTITMGDTVQLPKHLAADLLGGTDGLGAVDRVTLKLKQIREVRGCKCGLFDAVLIAESPPGERPKVEIVGEIAVEAATCRSMEIRMDTTLDVREQRGPAGATFNVSNRGKVRIAIQATYGDRVR